MYLFSFYATIKRGTLDIVGDDFMGFFDIFRRKKKNLALPEATKEYSKDAEKIEEEKNQDKKPDIRIYSYTDEEDKKLKYDMKLVIGEEMKTLGIINIGEKDLKFQNPMPIIDFKNRLVEMLQSLDDCKNLHTLTSTKNRIIEKLNDMESKYPQLNWSGVWDYVEQYGADKFVGYKELRGLPRKIDTSQLSPEEIKEYGKKVHQDLETLSSMQTIEDMTPEKEAFLLSRLMDKETPNDTSNAIVAANLKSIKNGEKLDKNTILKIAQQWEEKKENEDGFLLQCHFENEKARVSKRVVREIGEAMILKSSGDKSVMQDSSKKIAYLEKEVKNIQRKSSPELLGTTIMDFMKGKDVASYIETCRNNDLALIDEIVNNYSDTELKNKDEILAYLRARVGSLGQVSYKGDFKDTKSLRYFIENTDLKDPDDTQTKKFLLLVARVEERDLQRQYGDLAEKYKENLPLKERLHVTGINKQHQQPQGQVIEPTTFNREDPDEGKDIA